jgi:cell division protein FtsL
MNVLVTIISTVGVAVISLVGVIITNNANSLKMQHELEKSNDRIQAELDKHNAVQDTKLDELTREVREHNNFAIKIPVIEQRVTALEKETFKNKG